MVSSHAEKNFQGIILRTSQSSAQLHPAHLGVPTMLTGQHSPLVCIVKLRLKEQVREEQKLQKEHVTGSLHFVSECPQTFITTGQLGIFPSVTA